MHNYKGFNYEKKEIDGIIGFVTDSTLFKEFGFVYPLSKQIDFKNACDFILHQKQCEEMQVFHDKEIIRIFG